jgi:methionine synthase / methylenetetrahydrofolate reductase(NADPH)
MQPFMDRLKEGIILFDGAMGTMLYNKGVYINQSFELVNLSAPHMIKEIHQDYINAGCEAIETNTFGANYFKLKHYGMENKLFEVNQRGAEIARSVAGDRIYVAGVVGPLGFFLEPLGNITETEARQTFRTQIEGLLAGGVDLLMFETFYDLNELKLLIEVARELTTLPIIAQGTFNEEGKTFLGTSSETFIKELDKLPVEIAGFNCSVGPAPMLAELEKTFSLTQKPFSCIPNAGNPRVVEGRNIYLTTPEYMAEYAKRFIQTGARIVGGCCGTTPAHIASMRSAIKALFPGKTPIRIEITEQELPSVPMVPAEQKSVLARKLVHQEFITSVEITPPRSCSPGKVLDDCRLLKKSGVDAVNIPDGPRASARLSPMVMAILIEKEVGLETVLHYCCRDRNIIGMQSDLLGAYAAGLRNILIITGDPPKLGDYPDATAVFDVDSIGLTKVVTLLNRGLDIGKNPIGAPTGFYKGVGLNPGAIDLEDELRRLAAKVEAGAEFAITQPVYDPRMYEKFLPRIEKFEIPIIAGIWPLVSYKNAEFMNNEVPGASVPEEIMARMREVGSGEEARAEGIKIAGETLQQLRPMIAGAQVSAPFGRVEMALEVFRVGGILKG